MEPSQSSKGAFPFLQPCGTHLKIDIPLFQLRRERSGSFRVLAIAVDALPLPHQLRLCHVRRVWQHVHIARSFCAHSAQQAPLEPPRTGEAPKGPALGMMTVKAPFELLG
jgi:hypothetical protein